MAGDQTPQGRNPDRPGEPDSGTPEDGASSEPSTGLTGPTSRRPRRTRGGSAPAGDVAPRRLAAAAAAAGAAASSDSLQGEGVTASTETPTAEVRPDSDARSASAAAAAAVSAVSAAIAASKSKPQPRAFPIAPSAPVVPAASARTPVAVEGYVRAPGREIPGLIRANHDEAEGAGAASFAPSAQPPTEVDSHSRYKRPAAAPAAAPAFVAAAIPPVPDVPGIIRAHREEADTLEEPSRPAPLFSNEGIVRESQARPGNRVLAPIAGFFGALLDAGSALGHSLGSYSPGTKPAIASPILSGADPGSPDFDRFGNPRVRGRRRRRTAAAMLLGGLVIVGVLGLTLSSVLLPTPDNNGFPHSPGTSGNPIDNWNGQLDGNTTADPNALPSGVAIGDDPLAPGATRRPGGGVATSAPTPSGSFCWTMPAPSATASASASGSTSPGPSSSASSSASVTPRPSPTPIKTTCPAPTSSHNPTPQPSLTPTPTATPIPTPTLVPTPSPTPEMLAVIYSVTPPAVAPGYGTYIVGSLPGASCQITRRPVVGDMVTHSATVTTGLDGWSYFRWESNWPAAVNNVTVTFYATCTAAAPDLRAATSADFSVQWPPLATPTPTPILSVGP